MIRPYWVSEDRWPGLGLLLVVVSLTLGMVYLSVLLNRWNNDFFSALQEKNAAAFRRQLVQVGWLVGAFIVLAVYQLYLNQMLEIRWRRWLTERYLRAWLTDRAYYRMQLVAGETDNPDQRIAEDVQLLISHTLALFIGGLRAVVTLGTFVAILWGLSGRLTVPIGGLTLVLPGYMVWVSILYAAGGTWLTDWIGRPLVRLNFDRQRYEADFRFSLVRFRENTEGVALYRGEPDEFRGFRALFEAVVGNWWGIMRRQKRLTSFTSGYSQGAWIVPSVVAAPRYFRGELGLGGLMQTVGAFNQVQDALSFFVVSYKEIADWCAVVERLAGFERVLERMRLAAALGDGVRHVDGDDTRLTVEDVDLHLPDGRPLVTHVNLSLLRGDSVLLGGASGSGKSTLFRAIAGIWPFGRGEIRASPRARVLFLPQRPYLPIGTLRSVVSYPMPAAGVDDATLREALEAVDLGGLAGRLDEAGHWALQLSPGEQQRIAFARALVQKPDWLFLDEATAAVDEVTEARLYRLVRDRLPGTTLFSVGHRATLRPFHARRLVVERTGNGPASIVDEATTPG
ncbi:MAG TPA: ABC transporter ATP-binding protein/permease [Candidatus Dormibacteraeota bacterium]|jgi:vitamin B12/bleomycin/antimicrobial peptide transport system ATP-binding/permease protein|nr:ABC transporter ATP-binding protein/permease [Candidatus Dormibacteraeota bacterium]